MQRKSSEHEDIARLFHDAFVRICQLAIADCGVSVAELTLHLSIQLNTGVPQTLSTTVVETVRSPLVKDNSVGGGSEALNKALSVDGNNVDSHRERNESFASDHSFDSSVHGSNAETEDVNRTVTVGSVTPSLSSKSTFIKQSNVASSYPLDVNSVDKLILSEDNHGDVPLEELLADVGKSSECDTYVSERPVALLNSGENTREADKMYESSCASLSNLASSEDSLVAINGTCILSCNSDVLTPSLNTDCADEIVHNSNVDGTDNASFLQHCHFVEQGTTCSNSACSVVETVSDSTAIEVDRLTISLYSKTADTSAADEDTSYDKELVVDESCSCSNAHSCSESLRTDLCSSVTRQPACTETAVFTTAVSRIKPYPAEYLLSTLCHDAAAAADSSYSLQPNVLPVNTSSYRLIKTNADNTGRDTRETEFQTILSSMSTNVAAVLDADQGTCLHCIVLFTYFIILLHYFTGSYHVRTFIL